MVKRIACWFYSHRWHYVGFPPGTLYPSVAVAWPCVCLRCGKVQGILGEGPPFRSWYER